MAQYWNNKLKQDFPNVNITGGTITGISALQIPEGGTGGTTITEAQTNLSLLPGTDIAALVGGKIQQANLPAIAISDTFTVNTKAAMLALSAQTGDVAIRLELSKSFILAGTDPSQLTDWQELLSPTDAVQSVNGLTGTVVISDIPELSTARNLSSSGDVSWSVLFDGSADVDGVATVTSNSISNLKLADMAAGTIKGAISLGNPQDLSASQVRTLLNIEDGATANSTDATLLSRTNHTGAQPSTTITYDNVVSGLTAGEVQGAIDELDGVLDNLVVGTDVQAFSVELDAIAGLTSSANQLPLFTGLGTASLLPISTYAQGLLGNADAATARTTLELGTIATQNTNTVDITGGSIVGITDLAVTDGGTGASTATAARTNLKAIGSDATGITGASEISNIVALTQANYDAIVTPDTGTIYNITDAADVVTEGTFTPTLRTETDATEPTYTAQTGKYIKVGKKVTVICRVTASSTIATGTGSLEVHGLPFVSDSGYYGIPLVRQTTLSGIASGLAVGYLKDATGVIMIESDGAGNAITYTNIQSGSDFMINMTYFTT